MQTFSALIGQKIDSAGLNYTVVNAGSRVEMTAGGKSRISWVMLETRCPYSFLSRGGRRTSGSTSTSHPAKPIGNYPYSSAEKPTVDHVAGMQIPTSMGTTYTKDFRSPFKELTNKINWF